MSKSKNKLNGSVESLALSLHNVISDAVEKGNESMIEEMVAMEGRLNKRIDRLDERIDGLDERMDRLDERMDRLDERIDTTNQNMSDQFAAQAKYISEQIDKRLGKPSND